MRRIHPVELLLRMIVALVFVDSGWSKLGDPLRFSDTVRNYRVLDDPWVAWVAMGLPPFLLVVGLCVLFRLAYPGCVIAAALSLIAFVAALTSLLARGIDIDCGCLSFKFPISVQIGIDLALIAICAVLMAMWRRAERTARGG